MSDAPAAPLSEIDATLEAWASREQGERRPAPGPRSSLEGWVRARRLRSCTVLFSGAVQA